jgi:hypothetical protein
LLDRYKVGTDVCGEVGKAGDNQFFALQVRIGLRDVMSFVTVTGFPLALSIDFQLLSEYALKFSRGGFVWIDLFSHAEGHLPDVVHGRRLLLRGGIAVDDTPCLCD